MNLSLHGLAWKLALRAVPEISRQEILDTLTECYGTRAPVEEAVRTFTSGSRMRNRFEGASELDLWRIATRKAVVFSLAVQVGSAVQKLLPSDFPQHQSRSFLVFAAAYLFVAVLLCQNRNMRSGAAIIGVTGAIGVLVNNPRYQSSVYSPNLFTLRLLTAVAIVIFTAIIVTLHNSPKSVCFVSAAAIAGVQLIGLRKYTFQSTWIASLQIWFGFGYATIIVALIVLSIRPTPMKHQQKNWIPLLVGLSVSILGSVIDSTLLPSAVDKLLSGGLRAGLIGFVLFGVTLVAVRPQLFWIALLSALINLLPLMPWRFSGTEAIVPLLVLAGFVSLTSTAGYLGSRRALRV